MPPAYGERDLAEYRARMEALRTSFSPPPPTEPGAYEANTDGACLTNPSGPGGWAAVVEHLGAAGQVWELWGHLSSTSNNRAEALGVLAAVEWVPRGSGLLVRSDSELTVNVLSGRYKAKANMDVWAEIRRLIQEKALMLQPQWIRGHAGDPGNERADALSVLGAVNGDEERWQRLRGVAAARAEQPRRRPEPAGVPAELEGLVPRGAWERSFLNSVAKQLRAGRALSEKQQAVVERIRSGQRRPA